MSCSCTKFYKLFDYCHSRVEREDDGMRSTIAKSIHQETWWYLMICVPRSHIFPRRIPRWPSTKIESYLWLPSTCIEVLEAKTGQNLTYKFSLSLSWHSVHFIIGTFTERWDIIGTFYGAFFTNENNDKNWLMSHLLGGQHSYRG